MLPDPTRVPRGSLIERRVFYKQGCARCLRGEGHPVGVLSVTNPGGCTRQLSLRPEQKSLAERWLRNYQRMREKLEAISELSQQLLRAGEEG